MPDTKDENNNSKTKVIDNKEIEKRRETKSSQRTRIIIISVAAAAVIFLIVFFVAGGYENLLDMFGVERDVSVTPTITLVEAEINGTVVIAGNGGTTIVYDEHGVTGYGADGKWKWNEKCSVNNPKVTDCGDFAVIADVGGTAAYAFDKTGVVWKYGRDNTIKSVFGKGKYICVIHDEKEYLSAVTVYEYEKKTSSLKELFTRKFSSHYMITGAISNDGKQMVLSGVLSDNGEANGIITFVRMSDGEIFSSEILKNNVYVKVEYADNNSVFAANSDSVKVLYKSMSVSSGGDRVQELWSRGNLQNGIIDVALVAGKQCVVSIGNDGAEKTVVKGFDTAGKELFNIEVAGNVIGMDSADDAFVVFTESHIYLYNNKGKLIGEVEAGFKIECASCIDGRHVSVCGDKKLLTASFE